MIMDEFSSIGWNVNYNEWTSSMHDNIKMIYPIIIVNDNFLEFF
jgi:hypothetical protein